MDLFAPFSFLLVLIALCLFEIVNSIDNAIVDAEVLASVAKKSRRIFMFIDTVFSILIVRGLLPWLIVFATIPSLGFFGAFNATGTGGEEVQLAIDTALPFLLIAAGTFFILLFFDWIFRKPKNFAHIHEKILHGRDELFHIFLLIFLGVMVFASLAVNPIFVMPIFIGATVFFVLHGIKTHFLLHKKSLASGEGKNLPDVNKLAYLEIIDAVFSVDSVLGAFAFTFSVPLIVIGAGLGAVVVRLITLKNIDKLKKYAYLRNGAMYSILFLGLSMLLEAFGVDLPLWLSPVITIIIIFYFIHRSHQEAKLLHALEVEVHLAR
jgi:hypothetical protein